MALLGLTSGLVVLNLPKPAPPIEAEVHAIAMTINLAARESVIDGKVRAIDVSPVGIEIFNYDGEWAAETTRNFVEILSVALDVEGQAIDLKARAKSKTELSPLIYLDATGNVTPFTLAVSGRDIDFTLAPDRRGHVNVTVQP